MGEFEFMRCTIAITFLLHPRPALALTSTPKGSPCLSYSSEGNSAATWSINAW